MAERALRAKRPSVVELLDALDVVNPTPHDVEGAERERRYQLKAALQSRLIERHPSVLAIRPDGELWVLALAGGGAGGAGRDAKHVVVSELSDPARAWAHLQTAGQDAPVAPATGPRAGAAPRSARWKAQVDALLDEGAVEEAAALALAHADVGGPDAVAQAFEIALEWLDSPAWVLSASLSDAAQRSDEVIGWRALALVRSDRLDEALKCLSGRVAATVGRAWLELGQRSLRAGRDEVALRAADGAVDADPGLRVRADDLRSKVLDHRRGLHADLEVETRAAADRGDWTEAAALADALARRVPGNPVARDVASRVAVERERERREALRCTAEQAFERGAFAEAARAFDEAAAKGDPASAERAKEARTAARAAEIVRQADAIEALLGTRPEHGLRKWLDAPDEVRARVAARPELVWLERLAAHRCVPRREWPELALRLARLDAEQDGLGGMRQIEALPVALDRIPEARLLFVRVHSQWVADGADALSAALDHLRATMPDAVDPEAEVGDLGGFAAPMQAMIEAIASLDGYRVPLELADAFREVVTEGTARANAFSALLQFESTAAKDPLAARRLARSHGWVRRERWAAQKVVEHHGVRRFAGDGSVPDLVCDRDGPATTPRWLDRTGRWLRVAEAGERWAVLRTLAVPGGGCLETVTVRAPWSWSRIEVEPDSGDGVWLVDNQGHAAHVVDGELVDLVELGSGSGTRHVRGVGERLLLTPRPRANGRFPAPTVPHLLWDPAERRSTEYVRWAVVEPLRGSTALVGVRPDGSVEWIGADGSRRGLGAAGSLGEPVVDPLDPERVLLVCNEAKPDGRLMLGRSTREGAPMEPLLWLEPYSETERVTMGVGDDGWAFVLGRNAAGERRLFGVNVGSGARWEVGLTGWGVLVTDPAGRRCSVVLDLPAGIEAIRLGATPPALPATDPDDLPAPILDPNRPQLTGRPAALGADLARASDSRARLRELLARFHDDPSGRVDLYRAALARRLDHADLVSAADAAVTVLPQARMQLLELLLAELQLDRAHAHAEALGAEPLPDAVHARLRQVHAVVQLRLGRREAAWALARQARASAGTDVDPTLIALERWLGWLDESDPGRTPTTPEGRWWSEVRSALRAVLDAQAAGDHAGAWVASRARILSRCPAADVVMVRIAAALAHPDAPWVERLVTALRVHRHGRTGYGAPLEAASVPSDGDTALWRGAIRLVSALPDGSG